MSAGYNTMGRNPPKYDTSMVMNYLHIKFRTPVSNTSPDTSNKQKVNVCGRPPSYFPTAACLRKVGGASVAPASWVRASAILLLLAVGYQNLWLLGVPS